MALVTVYKYKSYNLSEDEVVTYNRYATLEYIEKNPLVAIKKDSLELDESLLDLEGRYIPKEDKAKPL